MYSGIFAIILNEINIMRQKFWAICLLLLPLLLLCSCEPEGREEGGDGLSGMLTADDVLAVPAQKVLLSMGQQVPVIGWNNSMYAQMASPALTSVDIRMDRMAEAAADLLRQALEGKRETAFMEIEPVLEVRESFVPEAPAEDFA